MLSISLYQLIDPLVETGEGYWSAFSSYKEEERRREKGIEEGVFINGRRPANGRLGSHNIDINVARLIPTKRPSILPVSSLTYLLVRCCLYRHVN